MRHRQVLFYSFRWLTAVIPMFILGLTVSSVDGIDLKTWAEELVKKQGSPPIEILEPREVDVEHSKFLERVERAFRRLTGTIRTIEFRE